MTRAPYPALLVAVVAMGVYANTLGNGFVMDDHYAIVENAELPTQEILPLFTHPWGSSARAAQDKKIGAIYYRPLTALSLVADHALYGLHAAGYHATNTLLFALIAFVVTLALFHILVGPTDATSLADDERRRLARAALFGGLLFAVHSVHTEVVNLISYRGELLAALAYAIAIVVHVRWPRSWRVDLLGLPLLYALGLLAKESALTLPGWLLLASLLISARIPRGPVASVAAGREHSPLFFILRRFVPLVVVLATYLAIRSAVIPQTRSSIDFFAGLSPSLKALSVAKIFAHDVQLWFLPWPLAPFYDWTILPPALSYADGLAWFGVVEFSAIVAVAVALRRRAPILALGLAGSLVPLIPVLHILPLPVGAADRFIFLPSLGATLASAVAFAALSRQRKTLATLLAAGLLVSLGSWTILRNTHWRSDLRLQSQVIADYPQAFSGHYNLGKLFLKAGEAEKALHAFDRAERCLPGLQTTATWRAAALRALGRKPRKRQLQRQHTQ